MTEGQTLRLSAALSLAERTGRAAHHFSCRGCLDRAIVPGEAHLGRILTAMLLTITKIGLIFRLKGCTSIPARAVQWKRRGDSSFRRSAPALQCGFGFRQASCAFAS